MDIDSKLVAQLNSLPIPPAALVIDMRKTDSENDVLQILRVEIEGLANELGMQNINHWRYLTGFLAYEKLLPLTQHDIQLLRQDTQNRVQQRRSLGGRFSLGPRKNGPQNYVDDEDAPSFLKSLPVDEFSRQLQECQLLINSVRNRRLEATGDLGMRGKVGGNAMNPKVQVIFLVDEDETDTLASAAAYASHLKHLYSTLERKYQVLDTMIICLNHANQANVPRKLLKQLYWPAIDEKNKDTPWWHIDSLILSENYGENAAYISREIQSVVAELLLYSILITQPFEFRPRFSDNAYLLPSPEMKNRMLSLPEQTYVVGLSAIEHSARWGRRLVNYGLVNEIIEVLQDQPQVEQQATIGRTADIWLSDWRAFIKNAIPGKMAGDIPELQAFQHSNEAAQASSQIFASSNLMLDTGTRTVKAIEEYIGGVAQTYTMTLEEREKANQAALYAPEGERVSIKPSLQDALGSTAQILQQVNNWQEDDVQTPIIQANLQAQRILSDKQFFKGAQGAVPRARLQLQELGKSIRRFQNEHKQVTVNLEERRKPLLQILQDGRDTITAHQQRFPLLAGFLRLKGVLQLLTLLLVAMLIDIGVIIAFAWLHHIAFQLLPDFTTTLDTTFVGDLSLSTLIILLTMVVITLSELLLGRTRIINSQRTALRTEIYFWFALICFPILGFIVSISASLDTQSETYVLWLNRLPFWSSIILLIAVVILIVEALYYAYWRGKLVEKRKQIVRDVEQHQRETSQLVAGYIADVVALELLRRAQLTDGTGNTGLYYKRIDELGKRLDEIHKQSSAEYDIAVARLNSRATSSLNSTNPIMYSNGNTPSVSKQPTLQISHDLLNVQELTISSKRVRDSINNKHKDLAELAELLLRIMGEESPISIEYQLRERPFLEQHFGEQPFQESRDQHDAQLLLSTAVALAIRMSIAIPKTDYATPLKKRYEDINYHIVDHFSDLKPLLDLMQQYVAQETRDANKKQDANTTSEMEFSRLKLATHALAIWGQMVWEHKEEDLNKMLNKDGVIAFLQQRGYDPQTVKSMLSTRTIITGISDNPHQIGQLSLLIFPSAQGRKYFQEMQLEPHYISMPDNERLILLYVHQYLAHPMEIVDEAQDAKASPTNGHTTNNQSPDYSIEEDVADPASAQ